MKRLKEQCIVLIILACLSIISIGFATWTISETAETTVVEEHEIKAYDIKYVEDFVNLSETFKRDYKGDAIEKIYYTSEGFTQSNSSFDKSKVTLMSYYVIDTSKFTNATYIDVTFNFEDTLGDFLSSNTYYLKADLYDSAQIQKDDAILSNDSSTITINLNSTTGEFGSNYYLAVGVYVQDITDFDDTWLSLLQSNKINLKITSTLKSDIEGYWLITSYHDVTPQETQYVDLNWDYSSEFTYDRTTKKVSLLNERSDIKIKYTNNEGIDADSYTAEAKLLYGKKYIIKVNSEKVANESSCSISWKINPKVITLTSNLDISSSYSIDYLSVLNSEEVEKGINTLTWEKFKKGINTLTFDDGGLEVKSSEYSVYGISDGNYLYSDSDELTNVKSKLNKLGFNTFVTKYTYVPGSTYIGYVKMTTNNFKLDGQDSIYIKYKTTKIGDSFYTIEDAINDTTTTSITMVGNLTTTETDVQITSFSKILDTNTYTNSNHNLIVPYESLSTTEAFDKTNKSIIIEALTVAEADKKTCGCLYIPSGITYNTTKALYITSKLAGCGICGAHGVVINDGTMNFNSNSSDDSSTLYAYGYLKGLGNIVIDDGAKVQDIMVFKDYPGSGWTVVGLISTCFPMFAWLLNNVSCRTKYMKGSELVCFASLWGSSMDYQTAEAVIIGKSSEIENCLFTPSSTATELDYIEKYTDSTNCNTLFTYENQINVLSEINISGNYEDRAVALSIYSYSFKTNYKMPLPISYININIDNGSLKISNSSYFFLQGTKLKVGKNAELSIDGDSYIIFDKTGSDALVSYFDTSYAITKTNAVLELNGTVSGTGSIAGTVETSEEGAVLQIDNYSVKYKRAGYKTSKTTGTKNLKEIYSQYKAYHFDTLSVDNDYSTITNGEYKSTCVNGSYGWFAYKAVINYELNGGTTDYVSKEVDITSQGYTLSASDIPSNPSKQYYNFINWTLNGSDPIGQTIYNGVTLVANYEPINYTIEYHDVEKDMESSGYSTTWNNPNSFNYETSLQLSDPTRGDLVFGGWFVNSELSTKVTMLDGSNLVKYLDTNNVLNLYVPWYSSGTASYKIIYDNSDSNGAICQDKEIIVETDGFDWSSIALPDMSDNDNDYTISTYFDGWYSGTTKVTSITSDLFDENNELNLKAVYKDKVTLNLQFANTILKTVYYKSGYTFTIPDLESYPQITISSGYVYIGWILSDGTTKEYYKSGDVLTLTNQTILEPDIRQYVNFYIKSGTYIKANVSLITNEGYIVEFDEYDEIVLKQFGSNAFGDSDGDSKKFYGTSNKYLVTVGSKFKAYYTLDGDESLIYDIVATITGTTPTTDLVKGLDNAITYEVVSEVTIEVTCERKSDSGGSSGGCFAKGTMVTLSDGSKKKVEDVTTEDTLLVFNHETGKYDFAKINFIHMGSDTYYTVVNLKFSNNKMLKVIFNHGFFDLDLMQYVYIDEFNYKEYIGHKFYSATWDGVTYQSNVVTLEDAYISKEYTSYYGPVTMYHLNYFAEDLLTMPGGISGLFNIFEYDSDLKYNSEKMQADIEKYGLFTYEYFKDKVPYEIYKIFPAQYFKIAIAKGILTEEMLNEYINRYLPLMT